MISFIYISTGFSTYIPELSKALWHSSVLLFLRQFVKLPNFVCCSVDFGRLSSRSDSPGEDTISVFLPNRVCPFPRSHSNRKKALHTSFWDMTQS